MSAKDHYAAKDTGIINIETITGGVRECFLAPPILVSRLAIVWCGCIMTVAAILFFIAGLGYEMWEKCWIIYPIGWMLCKIVRLIINGMYGQLVWIILVLTKRQQK